MTYSNNTQNIELLNSTLLDLDNGECNGNIAVQEGRGCGPPDTLLIHLNKNKVSQWKGLTAHKDLKLCSLAPESFVQNF